MFNLTNEDLRFASEIRLRSTVSGATRLARRDSPDEAWEVTGFYTPLTSEVLLSVHSEVEVLAEFARPRLRDIIRENIHVYQYPAKDRPGWNLFYRLSYSDSEVWFDTTTRSYFYSTEGLEDHLIQEGVDLTDIVGLCREEVAPPF